MHRRVDRFTDTHPAVEALRARFANGRRRYAGIVLDVYFDHCLARDWARWSETPLDAFTARVYRVLDARFAELPPRLQAIAPRMSADDWLAGYRHRGSVDRAIRRIAGRLSRHGDRLVACLDDLPALEAEADATFPAFYTALQAHVLQVRASLAPGAR